MNVKYTKAMAVLLVVLGLLGLFVRNALQDSDAVPSGDRVWLLTINVTATVAADKRVLFLMIPRETRHLRLVKQNFSYPGWRLKRTDKVSPESTNVGFATRSAGKLELEAEFSVHASSVARWPGKPPLSPLPAADRERYLVSAAGYDIDSEVVRGMLAQVVPRTAHAGEVVDTLYDFVQSTILLDNTRPDEGVDVVLEESRATSLGRINTFIALCRASKVPARLVTGVVLKDAIQAGLQYWAEVYIDEQWQPYDIDNGYREELPASYMPWRYNEDEIAFMDDNSELELDIHVERDVVATGLLNRGEKNITDIMDLTRMSLEMQSVMSKLLVIPFGLLLTTLFRQVVGIRTYGTFTASLIAMSLLVADWVTVSVIVFIVTTIGVGGRSLLPKKMSRVPRLSVVFVTVVFCVTLGVSLLEYYGMSGNSAIVLLPIVVLASLVDSAYRVIDEDGPVVALIRLGWTMVVALLCFLLFQIESLSYLVLAYPEIHCFTLAAILLSSIYAYRKLTDFAPFSWATELVQKRKAEKPAEREPQQAGD